MSHVSLFARNFAAIPALVALAALPAPAQAQGDLLVAPTRVIINGGGSAEVVLSNIGNRPATYRIGLEVRRMTSDGGLEAIDEANLTPEDQALLAMFRHAPRRITLPPDQPQSVRISARPPADLPDGEYRVHMTFRAIPDVQAVENAVEATQGGLSIRLTPIYGVSIPVMVRKGRLTGGAGIAGARVVQSQGHTSLEVGMTRSGNRSVYGEIRVVPPGSSEPAFLVRGIAIYPEVESRTLKVELSPAQAAALKGPMTVEYREMPENGGQLIASQAVTF